MTSTEFTEAEARDLAHYGTLPEAAKQALAMWIALACKPLESRSRDGQDSYSMKQPFSREFFYVTTGQFAGAFKAAGYHVKLPTAFGGKGNWQIYCRPLPTVHHGQYKLDHCTEEQRAEVKRLSDAAQVAIWGSVRT